MALHDEHDHSHHGHDHHHGEQQDMVIRDPVCGMTVDPKAGKPSLDYHGRTFHFCCDGCRKKFEATPENYLTAKDPVCGMDVDRASARHFLKHEGEKFLFRRLQGEVRGCARRLSRRQQAGTDTGAKGYAVYLSDAS